MAIALDFAPDGNRDAVGYRGKKLVELGFGAAGFGGDNGWGYNHSNEGEGYQEVMHGVISLAGVLQNSSTP